MFARVLHAVGLVLALALACSCSGPTTPSRSPYSPQPPAQPSPPTGEAISIEGEYRLTITASPNCSLPPEVSQRAYTATIREMQAGNVTVTLSGAEFVLFSPGYDKAGFEGTRLGNTLHLVIDNGYGAEYMFIERIDGNNLLFEGAGVLTIGDNGIEGRFGAEIRYFVPGQGPLGTCTAADHRMVFTR